MFFNEFTVSVVELQLPQMKHSDAIALAHLAIRLAVARLRPNFGCRDRHELYGQSWFHRRDSCCARQVYSDATSGQRGHKSDRQRNAPRKKQGNWAAATARRSGSGLQEANVDKPRSVEMCSQKPRRRIYR